MLELRPEKKKMQNLIEFELPNLRKSVKDLDVQIDVRRNELVEKEEQVDVKHMDMSSARTILPDLAVLDKQRREVERLKLRISTLKIQLGDKFVTRSIKEVTKEQEDIQTKLESITHEIEETRQIIYDHREQEQKLNGRLNDLEAERLQSQENLLKRDSLIKELNKLIQDSKEKEQSIKDNKENIKEVKIKLEKSNEEKSAVSKQKEAELNSKREEINNLAKEYDDFLKKINQIKNYIEEGKANDLMKVKESLHQTVSEINRLDNMSKETTKQLDDICAKLAKHEFKLRALQDNKKWLECKEEIKKLKSSCEELNNTKGNYNHVSLRNRKQLLQKQEREFLEVKAQNKGRFSELQTKLSNLVKELNSPMFKDSENKYKNKLIEVVTSEITSQDLDKYYKALNHAVMDYHSTKMKDINKIIKELWIQTYTSHDIDYIEIRADEEDAEKSLSLQRRTYNYRVVMIKGSVAIDMRGRCSAGQKVLASLVIRLALAESFCLNCGILALDEPTTNLDRDNIESLAIALGQIVNARAKQKNFQLLVITHDEDFIQLLSRSAAVEHFYRVSKDENGMSCLTKCVVGEI